MSEISLQKTVLRDKHAETILWETLACGDTGEAYEFPFWAAGATAQIMGTFNSQTLTMQGSNDSTNWYALTDPQGNDIAKTAAALEVIEEYPRYIRPSFSGSSGGDIDVLMFVRR